jgi:hypothetical protein
MSNCDYEPAGPITITLQMGATMLAVGALAALALPLTRTTCGSARSAHIKWEQRKAEVEKAIGEQEESQDEKID